MLIRKELVPIGETTIETKKKGKHICNKAISNRFNQVAD